jgi:hypothetical protein
MAEETEKVPSADAKASPAEESLKDESKVETHPGWQAILRRAFEKARREGPVANRRELGRDRSRSLFLLVGAAIAVLLLFLGVFSSPNRVKKTEGRLPGTPDLGRRMTPGQQVPGQGGSVAPLLSADTGRLEGVGNQDVTPQDVSRTARLTQAPNKLAPSAESKQAVTNSGQYALGRIDFSAPNAPDGSGPAATRQQASVANASSDGEDLRKPSVVFVRSAQNTSVSSNARLAQEPWEESLFGVDLPAGTRLVARLQSAVNTGLKTPVVAAIEYNYEREGAIVVPAGAKALGSLQQADRSGNVAIRFDSLQMPDGTTQKIEATAMSLAYGPLKGNVSGKRTGTRFLVQAFTGLGTVATYMVGAGGRSGFNGPLSESALLRDRIATNVGIAGDQELNSLAFNQNIVVTVPGNTRFYLVIQKVAAEGETHTRPAGAIQSKHTQLPTVEELRQLLELHRELSEMYLQPSATGTVQQVPENHP